VVKLYLAKGEDRLNILINLWGENMEWMIQNKEWLFSGAGITVIVAAYQLCRRNVNKKGKGHRVTQKNNQKENSTSIQVGRDLRIERRETNEREK